MSVVSLGTLAALNDVSLVIGRSSDVAPAAVVLRLVATGFTGTVTFQGSVDGVNWDAIAATPLAGGSAVTTATASGSWRIDATALAGVRCQMTAFTAGTVAVTGNAAAGG